jgi:hypothetical protein
MSQIAGNIGLTKDCRSAGDLPLPSTKCRYVGNMIPGSNIPVPEQKTGLVAWYDFSDNNNSGRMTLAGSNIVDITDRSSYRQLAFQSSPALQPELIPNVRNGLSMGRHITDALIIGQPSQLNIIPEVDEITIVTITNIATTKQGTIIGKAGQTIGFRQWQVYRQTTSHAFTGGGSVLENDTGSEINGLVIMTCRASTTAKVSRVNNANEQIGTMSGNTNTADWLIGARRGDDANNSYGFHLDGDIGDILIYNRYLTDTELNVDLYNWAINKWGTP